jgi:transcriptional regulator with XRE-family HTH domain
MIKKTLGQSIRELRQEKDVSVRELAKRLSLSPAFLSDIELGRRHPSDEKLTRIARALGTPVEELRKLDTRPAVEDLRRMANTDPAYGFAFRQIVDDKLSPRELLELVNKHRAERRKK